VRLGRLTEILSMESAERAGALKEIGITEAGFNKWTPALDSYASKTPFYLKETFGAYLTRVAEASVANDNAGTISRAA